MWNTTLDKYECLICNTNTNHYLACHQLSRGDSNEHRFCLECLQKLILYTDEQPGQPGQLRQLGQSDKSENLDGVQWKCPVCRAYNGLKLSQLVAVLSGSWRFHLKMAKRSVENEIAEYNRYMAGESN